MSVYRDKPWKRNWDHGVEDLAPVEYDTTFLSISKEIFETFADQRAIGFMGVDITFGKMNENANRFSQMLLEKGFQKGDVVAINLPNIPEYLITVIGTLRAGCIVSGWISSN